MFDKLIISTVLLFILNKQETCANPVEALKLLQIFNGTNYRDFGLKDSLQMPTKSRKKRFFSDIIELFSLLEDYYDDDEDDVSSDEESSAIEIANTQPELCRNFSVTFNKVDLVQHAHQDEPSSSTPKLNNAVQRLQPMITNKTVFTSIENSAEPGMKNKNIGVSGTESLDVKGVPVATDRTNIEKEAKTTAETAERTKPSTTTVPTEATNTATNNEEDGV